ncbi:MAG: hypothetical protein MK134_12850, partial [Dehalococcoidia bacterium]|nr:hypothetical protein [Dehalococcoidia bacterium]
LRTDRERDQDGDGGNERLHAALLCVTGCGVDPTAGGQGMQCGGLRLTRVRGVPQCEREEVEALFRVQCEGAARVRQPRSSYASP